MIILNWLPELAILIQLFICLVCLNFKPLTYRSLSLCIAIFSGMVLFYFVGRSDLAYFTPSEKILSADSLSYFGRIFSLIVLTFGSLSLHFHSQLPYHSKQTANLFLLFLAAFMNILVLSNSVLLLAVGWMGCYLSVSNIILIESGNHFRWVQMIRQHTFSFAAAIALFGALFVLMGSSSSLYISDYMEWLKSAQDQFHVLFATGAVILVLGVTLTHSMVLKGKGPLGLALSSLFLFIIGAFFWFRI